MVKNKYEFYLENNHLHLPTDYVRMLTSLRKRRIFALLRTRSLPVLLTITFKELKLFKTMCEQGAPQGLLRMDSITSLYP